MTFVNPASPSHPIALATENRTLRTTRRSLCILSLLLSVLMAILIGQRQDSEVTERDRQLLRQAWQTRQEEMLTDVRDYAFWGEA
ncbi:hypothetical protein [Candidatus Pantoea persica]|uniref:hypothetical protein n=1 Tax=Candidatus Pantoea persica TaxID=2518128 RepID=UPI00215DA797|nr:hypothetical protein [Candidatus Pantoea persica]MBA2815459.1 bifunctional diguanylate cyclase/phosphodiesterase [Candidatus Pantoea persica]